MVAAGERGGSRRPRWRRHPRPQGPPRLKPPDLKLRQTLSKEGVLVIAKDELGLFVEKL